jgi:hypothetical protein
VFACSPVAAQGDAPPKCEKGTLVDYDKKECLVGDLHFKFGAITVEAGMKKNTTVTPVDNGFTFEITVPKEGDVIPFVISAKEVIPFDVRNFKTQIAKAELTGAIVFLPPPKALGAEMQLAKQNATSSELTLRLGAGAFNLVGAELRKPIPKTEFMKVGLDFSLHRADPGKYSFTATFFAQGIKDAPPVPDAPSVDAPPACRGKLSDFLGKTCESSGLTFAFAKEFDGGGVTADKIGIAPSAENRGLTFSFPKLNELDMASFGATVSAGTNKFAHARLILDCPDGNNVSSSEGVFPKDAAGDLVANAFGKIMQAKFVTPPNSVKLSWNLFVNISPAGVTPTMTSTFVLAK